PQEDRGDSAQPTARTAGGEEYQTGADGRGQGAPREGRVRPGVRGPAAEAGAATGGGIQPRPQAAAGRGPRRADDQGGLRREPGRADVQGGVIWGTPPKSGMCEIGSQRFLAVNIPYAMAPTAYAR